jgi:hypothetical protein
MCLAGFCVHGDGSFGFTLSRPGALNPKDNRIKAPGIDAARDMRRKIAGARLRLDILRHILAGGVMRFRRNHETVEQALIVIGQKTECCLCILQNARTLKIEQV